MRKVLVAALVCLIVPSAALAHVAMHGSAKLGLIEDIFGGTPGLTHTGAYDCFAANRSTVNRAWAVTYFSGFTARRMHECDPVGSNGVDFVHFGHGHWHSVYDASDFPSCHLPGVPHNVTVDLAKSLPRGFGPAC